MSDIKGMFSFSSGATAWPELNWVVTDSLAAATEADDDSGRFAPPGPADVAFLQFTSGMDGGGGDALEAGKEGQGETRGGQASERVREGEGKERMKNQRWDGTYVCLYGSQEWAHQRPTGADTETDLQKGKDLPQANANMRREES